MLKKVYHISLRLYNKSAEKKPEKHEKSSHDKIAKCSFPPQRKK